METSWKNFHWYFQRILPLRTEKLFVKTKLYLNRRIWELSFFFFFKFCLFIFISGCAGSCAGFSLVVARRASAPAAGSRLLMQGFSCWAPALSVQATAAAHVDFAVPGHVGSSRLRDGTCVSCTVRRALYYWAARKAPRLSFLVYICIAVEHTHRGNHIAPLIFTKLTQQCNQARTGNKVLLVEEPVQVFWPFFFGRVRLLPYTTWNEPLIGFIVTCLHMLVPVCGLLFQSFGSVLYE